MRLLSRLTRNGEVRPKRAQALAGGTLTGADYRPERPDEVRVAGRIRVASSVDRGPLQGHWNSQAL